MQTIIEDRTTTWSAIGKDVSECRDMECVLARSGLDYTVEKQPIYRVINGEYIPVPNRFLTVRSGDEHGYDVVSDRYEVIQNRDAFDFVNYMGGDLEFLKAGETYSGMVYIIAKLPDVNILGDQFTPNVIFRNGFGGNIKITAAICPLRIVCQNQFNIAFKNTRNAITIKHTRNADVKLQEARDVLKMCADYMAELNTMAEHYAGIKLTQKELDYLLDKMFPMDYSLPDYKIDRLYEARWAFKDAYNAEDNQNFKGTAWGLINAYTDFITHKEPYRNTKTKDEGKFMTVTFAPGLMNEILNSMKAIGIS